MQYRVTGRYTSSLGGPWAEGELVDLDEEQAAALDRDCAGIVELVAKPDDKLKARRGRPTKDRMATGGTGDR